jgi:hypothetical protein
VATRNFSLALIATMLEENPMKPFYPKVLETRRACSAEAIRQMCKRGDLPSFRVGQVMHKACAAVEEIKCIKQERLQQFLDAGDFCIPTVTGQSAMAAVMSGTNSPEKRR